MVAPRKAWEPNMTAATIPIWVAVVAITYAVGCQLSRGEPIGDAGTVAERSIAFDDIAPSGLALKQCWNALGMDSQERVYIGFTSRRADAREDFSVFRYAPATGERRFLGALRCASTADRDPGPARRTP